MNVIWISIAAFGGGIVSALLGWLESSEPFNGRKFAASVLRAMVAGGVFAIGYVMFEPVLGMTDFVMAFVAGAGVDVLGHRVAGSMR